MIVLYQRDGNHWKQVKTIEADKSLADRWIGEDEDNRSWSLKEVLVHASQRHMVFDRI
jgi:hypothetical protein